MVVKIIKEYTKPSGRVIAPGKLVEMDQAGGQALIDQGFAEEFAVNTADVGCQAMLQSHHIMGMRDMVQMYDPEAE